MTIHWCGTGLSAIPGLRRLIQDGQSVTVWNRTVQKARDVLGDLTDDIRAFDMDAIDAAISTGDVIVSMLPGEHHVPLAKLAISKGAHFVSSSYISPEMAALNDAAKTANVVLVNEVGLDPGIDHLMAHDLVEQYRASGACHNDNELSFISYCGGIPKIPNDFKYKFSWSPLGVLRALKSPSKSIRNFDELVVNRPWNAISSYTAPLPTPETFEVYPNRDSIPFIGQYHFDPAWKVKEFVRGTLRLNGWADAWAPVFKEIETLDGAQGEARLREMSEEFWSENAYGENDPDRVVLVVALTAERDGQTKWGKTYVLDAWGDEKSTAMARLVSMPVSFAIDAVLNSEIPSGVHAAPRDPNIVSNWLAKIGNLAQHMEIVDQDA
jgi:saccharopine dehydrogenase-like NADP-dependent oxidoreductase